MRLPIHFGSVLDQVSVSFRGPETLVSGELTLPQAEILLANLTAAVEAARTWRPAESVADLLG